MNKGAKVPIDFICNCLKLPVNVSETVGAGNQFGPLMVDLGAGGLETARKLSRLGVSVVPCDILPDYWLRARTEGFVGHEMDATVISDSNNTVMIAHVELQDAVLMEGLLVNLVDDDGKPQWERALRVVDMLTIPGGWVFGAVVVRQDMVSMNELGSIGVSEGEFTSHIDRWKERYRNNQIATGFVRGTVVVAKPTGKKSLEWSDNEVLRDMIRSGEIERYVHHVDPELLIVSLQEMGPKIFEYSYTLFPSRDEGRFYIGMVFGWQKGDGYRYHPWYKGLKTDELREISEIRSWYARARPLSYWPVYWTLMTNNLPDESYAPWMVEERDKAEMAYRQLWESELARLIGMIGSDLGVVLMSDIVKRLGVLIACEQDYRLARSGVFLDGIRRGIVSERSSSSLI